jgi:hypothetical protein
MKIFIKFPNNKTIDMIVYGCMTVANVKQNIDNLIEIPSDLQKLTFRGKELKNDQLLKNCGIKKGAMLHLNYDIRVIIYNYDNTIFQLTVNYNTLIKDIKSWINKYTNMYTPLDKLYLVYERIKMVDNKKLSDYNLKMNSSLRMNYRMLCD